MNSNSSRLYGPLQVRDLSEQWGQAKLAIGIKGVPPTAVDAVGSSANTSSYKAHETACMELPLSQYPNWHSMLPRRASKCLNTIKEVAPAWSKRKPSSSRIGALVKSVRGSIPSSAIWSMTYTPIYKESKSSGQTQPLNKATVENLI